MSKDNEPLVVLMTSLGGIPVIELTPGKSVVIGRNPITKIQNIKCSRELYQVELETKSDTWCVRWNHLKTHETGTLKEGQSLRGPGFDYTIQLKKPLQPFRFISPPTLQQSSSIKTSPKSEPTEEIKRSIRKLDTNDSPTSELPSKKLKLSPLKCETTSDPPEPPAKPEMDENCKSFWEEFDEGSVQIYHFMGGGKPSTKVMAFDFDGTLVETKSGAKFPRDGTDWRLFDKNLPNLIGKFANQPDPYRFVIFSNQKGVSAGLMPLSNVQQRIESCLAAIGIPCIAFCALRDNIYRKPRPGMWNLLVDRFNDQLFIDKFTSFYVGDAAGRKSALKKDHSCADILFSMNLDLHFLTPEQFRVGKAAKKLVIDRNSSLYNLPAFNPIILLDYDEPMALEIDANGTEIKNFYTPDLLLDRLEQEQSHCIVFIGLPAAGKSTFFSQHLALKGYQRINRDELGSMEKCEREFKKIIASSKGHTKLVIDNLNIEPTNRIPWIRLCENNNLKVIAFYFDLGRDHCIHNNTYRTLLHSTKLSNVSKPVPEWLIRKNAKKLVPPTMREGFSSIFKINFYLTFFIDRNKQDNELYFMYLNEK